MCEKYGAGLCVCVKNVLQVCVCVCVRERERLSIMCVGKREGEKGCPLSSVFSV